MTLRFRRFGLADLEPVGRTFAAALNELLVEAGGSPYVDLDDDSAWTAAWERDRRALFEHLSANPGEAWLAEEEGAVLGYARSSLRDGVLQLTEFFVHPERQRGGLGRELIARAFDTPEAEAKIVIATTRAAALARYLKSGVYPISVICDLEKQAEPVAFETDLAIEPLEDTPETLAALNAIDKEVLGFRRPADHRWLMADRRGFLYRRAGAPVGYGYLGRWSGPFALLDPADQPAVLAHAETEAAAEGGSITLMVPMANRVALDCLLARGYRFDDGFLMLFMTDHLQPRLDRYLCALPGFFT